MSVVRTEELVQRVTAGICRPRQPPGAILVSLFLLQPPPAPFPSHRLLFSFFALPRFLYSDETGTMYTRYICIRVYRCIYVRVYAYRYIYRGFREWLGRLNARSPAATPGGKTSPGRRGTPPVCKRLYSIVVNRTSTSRIDVLRSHLFIRD